MSSYLESLFVVHRAGVQAYLGKLLGNIELAADLTQETFLRFAETYRAEKPEAIKNERAYLYQTAHNLAIDHLRREGRRKTDTGQETVIAEVLDDVPSQEQQLASRDEVAALEAMLGTLSPRTRDVFVLTRVMGLTHRETAERLRISQSSVQKHLAIAIESALHALRKKP